MVARRQTTPFKNFYQWIHTEYGRLGSSSYLHLLEVICTITFRLGGWIRTSPHERCCWIFAVHFLGIEGGKKSESRKPRFSSARISPWWMCSCEVLHTSVTNSRNNCRRPTCCQTLLAAWGCSSEWARWVTSTCGSFIHNTSDEYRFRLPFSKYSSTSSNPCGAPWITSVKDNSWMRWWRKKTNDDRASSF